MSPRDSSAAKPHTVEVDGASYTVWTMKAGSNWKAKAAFNGKENIGSGRTEQTAIDDWRRKAKALNG